MTQEALVNMVGNAAQDLDRLADYVDAVVHRPLEYRTAGALEVRFPERIIDLVAVPYNEETLVPERRGSSRLVRESIAPGAFAGVERRANRVKVNRAHDVEAVVGRALALHPDRAEGLVAELRISKGPTGDDILELAADGALDASVAFAPFPGGEEWLENRTARRITKAYLGHIALTGDPAYDGAQVLAVRSSAPALLPVARVPTPNLDRILAERRARESGLDLTAPEA